MLTLGFFVLQTIHVMNMTNYTIMFALLDKCKFHFLFFLKQSKSQLRKNHCLINVEYQVIDNGILCVLISAKSCYILLVYCHEKKNYKHQLKSSKNL